MAWLYYYGKEDVYANNMQEDDFLMALAEGGYQVGELAKCYYPNGTDITDSGYDIPIEKTNELIKETNVVIFEAAIEFEDFFIRIDILNKVGCVQDANIPAAFVARPSPQVVTNDFFTNSLRLDEAGVSFISSIIMLFIIHLSIIQF